MKEYNSLKNKDMKKIPLFEKVSENSKKVLDNIALATKQVTDSLKLKSMNLLNLKNDSTYTIDIENDGNIIGLLIHDNGKIDIYDSNDEIVDSFQFINAFKYRTSLRSSIQKHLLSLSTSNKLSEEKDSIDTYRNSIKNLLLGGGVSDREVTKILDVKSKEISKCYSDDKDAKQCLADIFNIK
jgi:hypothetical protein